MGSFFFTDKQAHAVVHELQQMSAISAAGMKEVKVTGIFKNEAFPGWPNLIRKCLVNSRDL